MKLTKDHLVDAFKYLQRGTPKLPETPAQSATAQRLDYRTIRDREFDQVWWDEAVKSLQQVPRQIVRLPDNKPLDQIDNATLVMEMIKRGFAVMKLPEGGGPPEALEA